MRLKLVDAKDVKLYLSSDNLASGKCWQVDQGNAHHRWWTGFRFGTRKDALSFARLLARTLGLKVVLLKGAK